MEDVTVSQHCSKIGTTNASSKEKRNKSVMLLLAPNASANSVTALGSTWQYRKSTRRKEHSVDRKSVQKAGTVNSL
jgi:hypothetical protein